MHHRWRFAQTPERIYNQGSAEVLPDADVQDLGKILHAKGYQVFRQGPSLYAFKGLAGRLGPIGVHASMLAIMLGVAIGGLGGFKGSVMVPTGGDFLVAQVRNNTAIITFSHGLWTFCRRTASMPSSALHGNIAVDSG